MQCLCELPESYEAYKKQQHRWHSGPMQLFRLCFFDVLRSKVRSSNYSYSHVPEYIRDSMIVERDLRAMMKDQNQILNSTIKRLFEDVGTFVCFFFHC